MKPSLTPLEESAAAGIVLHPASAPRRERPFAASTSLCGLRALEQFLKGNPLMPAIQLSVLQLEELEEALRENQLLPPRSDTDFTVLHAALHQVTVWKWRARRRGMRRRDLTVAVDLPRFIISCAGEIEQALGRNGDWRVTYAPARAVRPPATRQKHELLSDLIYLDHFASYVLANLQGEPKWDHLVVPAV